MIILNKEQSSEILKKIKIIILLVFVLPIAIATISIVYLTCLNTQTFDQITKGKLSRFSYVTVTDYNNKSHTIKELDDLALNDFKYIKIVKSNKKHDLRYNYKFYDKDQNVIFAIDLFENNIIKIDSKYTNTSRDCYYEYRFSNKPPVDY